MAYGHFNQIGSKKLLYEIENYLSKTRNKQTTMTPEQKKAKEIFEKYRKIILSKVVVGNKGSGEILAAKACAIEEVRALIADNKTTYKILLENHAQRAVPPIIKREIELQNILTEIEKL